MCVVSLVPLKLFSLPPIPPPSNREMCTRSSLFTSNKMLGTHKCSLPLGFICDIFSVDSRFPQSSSFFAQFLCFFPLVSYDFREFIETETLSFPWAILTTKYRTDRHLYAGVLSLFYSHCLVVGHQNGGYVYHCLRRQSHRQ